MPARSGTISRLSGTLGRAWPGRIGSSRPAARGVNGPIEDLLFPINHGILYCPGYEVPPPFVVYRVDRFGEAGFEPVAERPRERMRRLATTAPIPCRQQNGGDYPIPSTTLRPGLGDPGAAGFPLHMNGADADQPNSASQEQKTI